MSVSSDRPAFPVAASSVEKGVTVREWLASSAMQGIVANGLEVMGDRVVTESERFDIMARRAYALADAMVRVGNEEVATSATASRS